MPLDQLKSLHQGAPGPTASKRRGFPPVLLPVGLILAFLTIFGLLFGSRLLPAEEVKVAPVIALRTAKESAPAHGDQDQRATLSFEIATRKENLLFQSSGWVEPDPYITSVPALVKGVVKEVHVLEGQEIKKDAPLASLIDDDAKLDVQEATRAIGVLDATQVAHCAHLPVLNAEMHAVQQRIVAQNALLAELEDSFRRLASVPAGSVPAQDVRQAQLKVDAQQAVIDEANAELAGVLARINKVDLERLALGAKISAAQTELSRKQLALDRTQIKSPIDGIVLRLHAAPGKKRMLDADDPNSALIVELYEPDNLQARIDVPLTEAAALSVGQPVLITTDLLPDAKFKGEVTRIVGEADLQRNTLQTKVRILNPDKRLRPEMLVRAEFYPHRSPAPDSATRSTGGSDRLTIFAPIDALLDQTGAAARAWVVEDERAQLRKLETGSEERDGHLHIIAGLRPGDRVILPPFNNLKEGKRIKISP